MKLRRVILALIGTALLVGLNHYTGTGREFAHSYGSNISFSFAAYFLLQLSRLPISENRVWVFILAFVLVSLSEFAQLYGFYSGIFDVWDFLFNGIGIVLALLTDLILNGRQLHPSESSK
ncbi:hypothetical protein KKC97_06675 [bacterium]|nr:hypothetical protein [bacterium]MBU1637336.1 hypothetical protein [bacterium]